MQSIEKHICPSNHNLHKTKRSIIESHESCISFIKSVSRNDGVWEIEEGQEVSIDSKKFYSNYPESVFKKKFVLKPEEIYIFQESGFMF